MMRDGNGAGWVIVTLLALVAIGAIVAWATTRPTGTADAARQILEERLARGDISLDEYRDRRVTLAQTRPTKRGTPRGLLVIAAVAFTGAALAASAAGTGGASWPAWMRTMHDQMWGARGDDTGQAPPPVAGAPEIRVVAAEFFFEPTDVRVPSGAP